MGAPPPAPPFVTPEIVSSSERPFTTSPDTIPSASPPRPPSVRSSASPPRPPCNVVTQFEEKRGRRGGDRRGGRFAEPLPGVGCRGALVCGGQPPSCRRA